MVFTGANVQQDNPVLKIQVLNLATGEISTLFQTTGLAWIYYMSVSPVTGQIVLSYSPPPGNTPPGQQALYSLPLDGSKLPQLLFDPPSANDLYLQAEWSPNGKYIYYVHSSAVPQFAGQLYPIYEIFRMAYPAGQPERIARYAFWPRISSDSSRLVYVSSDPTDGKNKLYVANADGSNARQVILTGTQIPDIIDAPIFSPDGQAILFSAPTPTPAYQPNWLEKLMGIQVAEAHTVPSDWWSVPLVGGVPKQMTHIQSPVLFASVSPDGRLIASYSGNGLFVMKPDGTGLSTLIPDLGGLAGMVSWLP
jgi:Tol biopolymer transport system component